MTTCETVLSDLWDWHANPHQHPNHDGIRLHLEACPACRAQAELVGDLRGCLKGMAGSSGPDPGFEAELGARLACLAAGLPDPQTGRFEPDPFLEEARELPDTPREALLVDRRSRAAWLVRPLSLVAVGAAAAILIGLIGRWNSDPQPSLPTSGAAPSLAGAAPAQIEADSLSTERPAAQPTTGVLAERAWQEGDSGQAVEEPTDQPDRRERLRPVTTTP